MNSKKFIPFLVVTLTAVSSIAALHFANIPWTIDKSHSSISFEIRHFFSNVTGKFDDYDATLVFDPENLAESSIDVSIKVASITTDNERRDSHLLTPDFFDAETYPTIRFTSERIESTGNNSYVAKGKLTIKDVTKDFELPFTLLGMMDHPQREGVKIAGFKSEFTLLRNDFGVGTGNYVSDAVIGNEVHVVLNIEANSVSE